MSYIGYKPADKPLTSADITDSIITSAKIVDGTIVNGDISNSTIALAKLSATGTADSTTFLRGDNTFAVPAGSKFGTQLLHVRDEKASGTSAGGSTSGSFLTRTLNTVLTNEISGASLSSNQITLPSGTYFIFSSAPFYAVDNFKCILRNITDSSNTLIGTSEYTWSSGTSTARSFVIGRFTISAQKTFEIQYRCTNGTAGNGLGPNCGFGNVEVYTDVQIWKVA